MNHIRHHLRRHTISLRFAFEGVVWAIRTQPNYRIHIALSAITFAAAAHYHLERSDVLILAVLVVVGFVIETLNSSIEATLDCVSLERREDIKIAKDAAAAAMLIFAVGATFIAIAVFAPYVLKSV
jgi:diacylglycerol kinase